MFTREEMLNASKDPSYNKEIGYANHRRYYAQLVSPFVLNAVESRFGMKRLLDSKDKHFNDIPLSEWDNLTSIFYSAFEYRKKLKELGGWDALVDRVCVLKEAARQLVEKHTEQDN